MKSSFHRVIPLLPLLLNHVRLPSLELDSVLDNNELFSNWTLSTSDNFLGIFCYISSERTPRKTSSSIVPYCLGMFMDPLPSNRCLIVARFGSRGTVFPESLRSNGSIRHNIMMSSCRRVYLPWQFLNKMTGSHVGVKSLETIRAMYCLAPYYR
jgi:hypothetical protein